MQVPDQRDQELADARILAAYLRGHGIGQILKRHCAVAGLGHARLLSLPGASGRGARCVLLSRRCGDARNLTGIRSPGARRRAFADS
jgi:hypothetical protein